MYYAIKKNNLQFSIAYFDIFPKPNKSSKANHTLVSFERNNSMLHKLITIASENPSLFYF